MLHSGGSLQHWQSQHMAPEGGHAQEQHHILITSSSSPSPAYLFFFLPAVLPAAASDASCVPFSGSAAMGPLGTPLRAGKLPLAAREQQHR